MPEHCPVATVAEASGKVSTDKTVSGSPGSSPNKSDDRSGRGGGGGGGKDTGKHKNTLRGDEDGVAADADAAFHRVAKSTVARVRLKRTLHGRGAWQAMLFQDYRHALVNRDLRRADLLRQGSMVCGSDEFLGKVIQEAHSAPHAVPMLRKAAGQHMLVSGDDANTAFIVQQGQQARSNQIAPAVPALPNAMSSARVTPIAIATPVPAEGAVLPVQQEEEEEDEFEQRHK